MNTLAVELHPRAHNVKCTYAATVAEPVDGRTISCAIGLVSSLAGAKPGAIKVHLT